MLVSRLLTFIEFHATMVAEAFESDWQKGFLYRLGTVATVIAYGIYWFLYGGNIYFTFLH